MGTATALAAMLTASGATARVHEAREHVRIDAALPEHISPAIRTAVLAALNVADRYGHQHTERADAVWAEIDKGDPTA